MKSILRKILGTKRKDEAITIVSGLPRCGTSVMMQMLEAGGMSIVTDNIRKPDEDNPRGYYEFEKVKKIEEDTSWLDRCHGKAFKMVSMLLYHLPRDKEYKVIFMEREMEEMLASQRVMLERLRRKGSNLGDEEMSEKYKKHLGHVKEWLASQGNIDVIYVSYNDIIECPYENAKVVSQFLGGWLDAEEMARVVEKSMYRQRKEKNASMLH
jgi:hypothetical protein